MWSKSTKKSILKSFCFCASLVLNLNLKDTDTPPELVKTWHRNWAFPYKSTGLSLIATEHLLWLRPSPHVAKLPSGVPVPVAPISYLEDQRSDLGLTDRQLKFQQWVEYKIPNMGSKTPSTVFWPSLHCRLTHAPASHKRTANFSALSGWKACTALSAKGKANAALPGHSQSWAKLKAASAKHRKQLQCNVFTSQSEIQLDCRQVQQVHPQRVRVEEPAPTQTALFMDNSYCTCLDAYL